MKVAVMCSGLGRIERGYESFAAELHRALLADGRVESRLFAGGPAEGATWVVTTLGRNSVLARKAGRLIGRRPAFVEQVSFALGAWPHLRRFSPQVIVTSEWHVGTVLASMGATGAKLLLSNSGPHPPPYRHFDHVQEVTGVHMDEALAAGEPEEKLTVVPMGFDMPTRAAPVTDRAALRVALGLPPHGTIVLSVGALNDSHKRHSHTASVVAGLGGDAYFVALGAPDEETPSVRENCEAALGDRFALRTVEARDVGEYYTSADVFMLGSISEGFGRVIIEAMSYGLPVVIHNGPVFREVGGEVANYADMSDSHDSLRALRAALSERSLADEPQRRARARSFSWETLTQSYVELFDRIAT